MKSIRSPQQLGEALRASRKQLGLTQPQLALAAGVGVRFIVDLEAGKPTLRLENILRVIDALGGLLNKTKDEKIIVCLKKILKQEEQNYFLTWKKLLEVVNFD